jgi:hypothetical protein
MPSLIKDRIDRACLSVTGINKVLIREANYKMDGTILKNLYGFCQKSTISNYVTTTTISCWITAQ